MHHANFWQYARSALAQWKWQVFAAQQPPPPDVWLHAFRTTDLIALTTLSDFPDSTYSIRDRIIGIAMIALGPRQAGDPPDHQWHTLRQIVQHDVPHLEPAHWLEVVIAWGCGWQRTPAPHRTAWDGAWEYAVLALYDMVAGSVRATIKQILRVLSHKFNDHPLRPLLHTPAHSTNLTHLLHLGAATDLTPAAGELTLYAAEITMELLPRLVPPHAAPPDRYDPHQLAHWQPAHRSLRVFLAEAVRGSASRELKTNAFRQGLLYPLLQQDFGIRVDTAEFKLCHSEACNGPLIAASVASGHPLKLSAVSTSLYEGARCPVCQTPADPARTYHIARRNWLLVPYDYGGMYELQARWHCPHCGTLFPILASYKQEENHLRQIEQQLDQLREPAVRATILHQLAAHYQQPPDHTALSKYLRHEQRVASTRLQHLKEAVYCPLCQHRALAQRPTHVWVLRGAPPLEGIDRTHDEYDYGTDSSDRDRGPDGDD